MSCRSFSSAMMPCVPCAQPVLTIGFPKAPSQNTVVLANGAMVDLNQLGQIVQQFCPGFQQ